MFKVDNKDTRTTSSYFTYNITTYFTPCASVYIVNFEHVIAGWEMSF